MAEANNLYDATWYISTYGMMIQRWMAGVNNLIG